MFRRCISNVLCSSCETTRVFPVPHYDDDTDELEEAKQNVMHLLKIGFRTDNYGANNNKEKEQLEYLCKSCQLILKTARSKCYPGINETQMEMFKGILVLLTKVSDASADASGVIVRQTGLIKEINSKLLHWHRNISRDVLERESQWIKLLIAILHNVSMYDDNSTRIKSAKTVSAVQPYLDFKNDTIRLASLATMADLIDESESNIIRSESDVIEFLMASISNALDAVKSRTDEGWSLVELTRIIHQIARNDNNKRMLVNHGAIPQLVRVCDSSNVKEQAEAVKAIWRLSFDKENREEMLKNTEWNIVGLLNRLSKSADANVKMISNKALWTINDQEKRNEAHHKTTPDKEKHIMISYNWGYQSQAKQIRDSLMRRGMKVWMDVDNMSGSTIDAMANAVEQAFVVLLCYSHKYKNSDNCRAEAEYAYQLKKKLIPVKMELGYKADGWLGFIIGARLFFDFSGKYPFDNKMNELYREITTDTNDKPTEVGVIEPYGETSSIVNSSPPAKHRSDKISKIRQWPESGVEHWLSIHDVPKEKLGKLRKEDVAFLCILLEESPDNFYRCLREQFKIDDINETANLRLAFHDLIHGD